MLLFSHKMVETQETTTDCKPNQNTPRFTPLQGSVHDHSKTIKIFHTTQEQQYPLDQTFTNKKQHPLSMHFRDDIQIASMLIHLPAKLLTAAAADFVTGFGSSVASSDMDRWTVS